MLTVADNIVKTLQESGVRRIYGLPGDSLNGFTDALRPRASRSIPPERFSPEGPTRFLSWPRRTCVSWAGSELTRGAQPLDTKSRERRGQTGKGELRWMRIGMEGLSRSR